MPPSGAHLPGQWLWPGLKASKKELSDVPCSFIILCWLVTAGRLLTGARVCGWSHIWGVGIPGSAGKPLSLAPQALQQHPKVTQWAPHTPLMVPWENLTFRDPVLGLAFVWGSASPSSARMLVLSTQGWGFFFFFFFPYTPSFLLISQLSLGLRMWLQLTKARRFQN